MLNITSSELWALLFPSCACTFDAERSHFIRRLPGNMGSFAVVVSDEIADKLSSELQPEHFYIQRINNDGLSYAVIWEATEWRHSNERRVENAQLHIASDASYISKKIHEYRKELIVIELNKLKLFTKPKSYELAEAITCKGEEIYQQKAEQFHKAFKGVYENVNIYFTIQQVAKIIDTKNILGYDTQATTTEDIQTSPETNQPRQEVLREEGETAHQERGNISPG
jgi:hypothetical protein